MLERDNRAEVDKALAVRRADELRRELGYTSYMGDTIEIHESGMLTFPILGTAAPIQEKPVSYTHLFASRKCAAQLVGVKNILGKPKPGGDSGQFSRIPRCV